MKSIDDARPAALYYPEAFSPSAKWTIRQLLRWRYPETGLRKRFKEDPFLDQVTLGQVLCSPFALSDFLSACRTLPQCGETSIKLLRAVIEDASRIINGESDSLEETS
jgi:hypothetical protein